MRFVNCLFVCVLVVLLNKCSCVNWELLRCSSDAKQEMPEGIESDIGRFPWLGILQHSFYIAGKINYAITGAVLIHPAFAIAAAEDVAKINPDQIINNTKLVLWGGSEAKYALDVKDVILHPQYLDGVTVATIALLDLIQWGEDYLNDWMAPVFPICLPTKGVGTFSDLYAVKMTDVTGTLQKEVLKMNFVDDRDCEEFYYRAQLSYPKKNPINPVCAVSEVSTDPCVWDSGTALITKQSWGFWKLIGFAVRGPGCGAPTRFLNIHDYIPWINDVITAIPYTEAQNTYKFATRRLSAMKMVLYKADKNFPKNTGQCGRKERGNVLYKDSSEFVVNKEFVQGFFYVTITHIAEFMCAIVELDVNLRTHALVWIEHNCHRDSLFGLALKDKNRPSRKRHQCFLYFKSTAFVEFRFIFSFKAIVSVGLYGEEAIPVTVPNPFLSSQHTTNWYPTGGKGKLQFSYFTPEGAWWYWL